MPINLCFRSLEEEWPPHGSEVLIIKRNFGWPTTIELVTIEYSWEEWDLSGPTGVSIDYDPNDPEPPTDSDYRLTISGDGCTFDHSNTYWCNVEALYEQVGSN
jgi:hypothetical protein